MQWYRLFLCSREHSFGGGGESTIRKNLESRLQVEHLLIESVFRYERLMCAVLDRLPIFYDENRIRILHCLESMRDDQHRPILKKFLKRL